MKWIANVFVGDIKHGRHESLIFPADSMSNAAREAARLMALRLYGDIGQPSFVNQVGDQPLFKANVGVYIGKGVTQGKSLSILLREYRGI